MTFEEGLERLAEIADKMTQEEPNLEKSIALAQEAKEVYAACNALIKNARQKITFLDEIETGGMDAELPAQEGEGDVEL